MQLMTKRLLALVGVMALGFPAMAATPLRTGDGKGIVEGYDRAQKTILVGKQQIALSPVAATTLEQQLAKLRVAAGQQFAARYNIVRGADGRFIIESIYVIPPQRK